MEDTNKSTKKPSRLLRWLKRIGLILAALVLIVLAAGLTQSLVATRKLTRILERMERENVPTTWPELRSQIPNADARLVAQPTLFAALDRLSEASEMTEEEREMLPVEGLAELPTVGSNLPPAMVTALEKRLEDVGPALEAVCEVVLQEPVWLAPPTNAWSSTSLSRISSLRRAARLFHMRAILESEKGSASAATKAALDGIRLSRIPGTGGLLIDELVRFACEGIAVRSVERVLAKTDPTPAALDEMAALLSEHHQALIGVLGEMVYTKQLYEAMPGVSTCNMRAMTDLADARFWHRPFILGPLSSGWLRMNEACQLEFLLSVVRAWDLPWERFKQRHEEACAHVPSLCILAKSSAGMYDSFKNRELRAAGAWHCARVAIAIEQYTRRQGALPESLAQLVPRFLAEVPAEPFYGEPFSYEREGGSATLGFPYPDSEQSFSLIVLDGRDASEAEGKAP